jgi:hypothetical protein
LTSGKGNWNSNGLKKMNMALLRHPYYNKYFATWLVPATHAVAGQRLA